MGCVDRLLIGPPAYSQRHMQGLAVADRILESLVEPASVVHLACEGPLLVAEIVDEFGFEARVRLHVGSFSVRFSRA